MSGTAPRCNTCGCWERTGNSEFGVCTLITRSTLTERNGADSPFARAYCSVETHERFGCVLWEPHDTEGDDMSDAELMLVTLIALAVRTERPEASFRDAMQAAQAALDEQDRVPVYDDEMERVIANAIAHWDTKGTA